MTETIWAPYGDAVKIILIGSADISLSTDQKFWFQVMLNRGIADKGGNRLAKRNLPDVRTREYCVDEAKDRYETMYHIPDLFMNMVSLFGERKIESPPVCLDYLKNVIEESLDPDYMDIAIKLYEVHRTTHEGDPLKLKAQKDMIKELENELASIGKNDEGTTPDKDIKNSFRFETASWLIKYHGQSSILADAKGIRYIVWLIQNQGKEISAFELYNAVNALEVGPTDHPHSIVEEGFSKVDTLGDAGATMDEQTKREIINRINELNDEIEIAADTGNHGNQAQLETELDELTSYLSSGLDHRGRPRRVSSDIKKRTDSVKASIKRSVEKIDKHLPLLGKHLKGLHLGSSLSYAPDHPVAWVVNHTTLHPTT